jgi:hypothetical protein
MHFSIAALMLDLSSSEARVSGSVSTFGGEAGGFEGMSVGVHTEQRRGSGVPVHAEVVSSIVTVEGGPSSALNNLARKQTDLSGSKATHLQSILRFALSKAVTRRLSCEQKRNIVSKL